MLYKHVSDKISTEFHGILRVFGNFAALRPREISEALLRARGQGFPMATRNVTPD